MGDYSALLKHLPPVDFGFAYGSGVFKQEGYEDYEGRRDYSSAPMLDLVFSVKDPVAWHAENLQRNWSHYSWLKYLGPKAIAHVQEDYGASIYYNTTVPCPDEFQRGRLMKYGVMSTAALREDLRDWTWLYVAGRMHKPVSVVQSCAELQGVLQLNLRSAVRAALLLLPETFSDFELFTMIAGLSYRGDPRMTFGENPRKVKNIVSANLPHFHDLYRDVLQSGEHVPILARTGGPDSTRFQQDKSPRVRGELVRSLPHAIRAMLERSSTALPLSNRPYWESMKEKRMRRKVKVAIHRVVAGASWRQSLKGVLTAGVFKALSYGLAKVDKMRKGIAQQRQDARAPVPPHPPIPPRQS